jgi:hypothetical protein
LKLTDRQTIALADDNAERALRAATELPVLLIRLEQWSPAGTTSPGGDGGRAGGTSKPVERKAIPPSCDKGNDPNHTHTRECRVRDQWREDEFSRARKKAIGILLDMQKLLNGYDALVRAMSVLSADEARRLAETEAACGSECANCSAWITGLGADRPRSGRCRACYEYRRRNEGMERPHSLVHAPPINECVHCQRLIQAV